MNFIDYQNLASRTARLGALEERLSINAIGLAAEVGELCSDIQHMLERGTELDYFHVAEECGDVLWRVSDLCTTLGISLDAVAEFNIDKLRRRHPNGFSAETSVARMDEDGRQTGI